MTLFNYAEFISRNYAYIDTALQKRIKETRLVFTGCGLASVIAEGAARLGFIKFILIDPDKVELSNLNRQNFYTNDIGHYKVQVLANKLQQINSEIKAEIFPKAIETIADIKQALLLGDIIINTIDYGPAYFDLVHHGMQAKKLIICPFNPGFAGLAVCFAEKSATLHDILGTQQIVTGLEFPQLLRQNNTPSQLPYHFSEALNQHLSQIEQKGFNPQMAIGAQATSALVLSALIKYLNQDKIPLAPELMYQDVSFYKRT